MIDPKLGQAVENAAKNLPDGCTIRLEIENGYAGVVLNDPEGESTTDFPHDELSSEIDEAVSFAVSKYGSQAE